MSTHETWLPVVGFEDLYEVSESGRVRALPRVVMRNGKPVHRVARELKTYPNVQTGYMMAHLTPREGAKYLKKRTVHQLVLEAFVGPRPDGYQACHNDGSRTNNHVSNLRWDTVSANAYDRVDHGRHPYASRDTCSEGHPMDGVSRYKDGSFRQRFCKTCHNAVVRRNYHAKRAEKAA
jgi:hypothetical protein